jgi:hypothetical protein
MVLQVALQDIGQLPYFEHRQQRPFARIAEQVLAIEVPPNT